MHIGIAIKHVRSQKGLTQGELAIMCGLSRTAISQIETGDKRPRPKNLQTICNVLEVPETTLYIYGLEVIDVPDSKKELFRNLHPIIQEMIDKLVLD
jgi:XRE family transcriptional regulator, regulator of sulfur utilization